MAKPRSRADKAHKSLIYSILDGAAFSAMAGLTVDYITPFAIALKATTAQIGLLTSLPNVTSAISQLFVPRFVERVGARKRVILPSVFLHALLWLPILLVPFLFPGHEILWLIGLVTVSTVAGCLGNPAWGSMMADLVSEERRGKFFSLRGRICGFLMLLFFLAGGAVLQGMTHQVFYGFAVLFGGALFFRLISFIFLSRMYEPPLTKQASSAVSIAELFKNLPKLNLGRFIMFDSLIDFATYLSSPFFAVYMLRDMKFDYLTYVLIMSICSLANVIFLTFWGVRADRAGNIKVLRITSVLIPIVPILWLFNQSLAYLLVIQVISGFAWSGYNLASANFLYDAASPEKRTSYIAVSNALGGIAVCLGSTIGGLLAYHLPPISGNSLMTLFLISGIARSLVVIIFLRHIYEMRRIPDTSTVEVFFGKRVPASRGMKKASSSAFRSASPQASRKMLHSRQSMPTWRQKIDVAYRGQASYAKHDDPDNLWGG